MALPFVYTPEGLPRLPADSAIFTTTAAPQRLVPESPDLSASRSSLCSFPCHDGKDLSNCIVITCSGFNLTPAKSYLCLPPERERPTPRTPTLGIYETLFPVVTLGTATEQSQSYWEREDALTFNWVSLIKKLISKQKVGFREMRLSTSWASNSRATRQVSRQKTWPRL